MAKFFYLSLLALVAVTSAQEPGQCDPSLHQQVISGCDIACGPNTCRLASDSKPYCECALPPTRMMNISETEFMCTKFSDKTFEVVGGNYAGMECGTRCPPGQSPDTPYVAYRCDEAIPSFFEEVEPISKVFCVCSYPPAPKGETNLRFDDEEKSTAEIDEDLDNAIQGVLAALVDGIENLIDALRTLLRAVVAKVGRTLKKILKFFFGILNKINLGI